MYDKCTANVTLNGDKIPAIPLESGTTQGSSQSLLLFNTVLKTQAGAIRQETVIKEIQREKKKNSNHLYLCKRYRKSHHKIPGNYHHFKQSGKAQKSTYRNQ